MTAGSPVPRIAPGSREQIGWLNLGLARLIGAAAGGTRLGAAAGLSAEEIDRVRTGPDVSGWEAPQALLLRAADELHERRTISDPLWEQLRGRYSDAELIELCTLIGHYEMLAMTLNTLAVQPDAPAGEPPRALRRLQRVAERRGRRREGE